MLLNDVDHLRAPHLFFVHMAIIHGAAMILKSRQTRDECLLVSVKKTKKDTEEHRCHSESTIMRLDKAIPSKDRLFLLKSHQIKTSPFPFFTWRFTRFLHLAFNSFTSLVSKTTIRLIHGSCSSVHVSTSMLIKHFVSECEYPRKYDNTLRA